MVAVVRSAVVVFRFWYWNCFYVECLQLFYFYCNGLPPPPSLSLVIASTVGCTHSVPSLSREWLPHVRKGIGLSLAGFNITKQGCTYVF